MRKENIRVTFAREHTTIFPKLGVFLAGPTPPESQMKQSWRRTVIARLQEDQRLDPSMTVVAPEPRNCSWSGIDVHEHGPLLNEALNKQIPWEWQYLQACDISAFWLPTYWDSNSAENFPANIGPTSRWEFGYYLQEYLKAPQRRHFVVGGPEDAENVKWARRIAAVHGIKWHGLPKELKKEQVASSFIEEIADTLYEWKITLTG